MKTTSHTQPVGRIFWLIVLTTFVLVSVAAIFSPRLSEDAIKVKNEQDRQVVLQLLSEGHVDWPDNWPLTHRGEFLHELLSRMKERGDLTEAEWEQARQFVITPQVKLDQQSSTE